MTGSMIVSMNSSLPILESRFLPPEGWRWHSFTNPQGRRLRFGTVAPASRIPDAVVIMAPGLSEFGEKYFEMAHDLLARNLSLWVIDWQGQGLSDRHLKNYPMRRSSSGFDGDVEDFHYFIMEYVKHSAVHPDVGRIPLVLMGHSMGAHIGLRYLEKYPDTFACAAFSAPMFAIRDLRFIPKFLQRALTGLFSEFMGNSYVFGGKDWSPDSRPMYKPSIFSADPVRSQVQAAWFINNPALQVGNPTFRWLYEAITSCRFLNRPRFLRNIKTPVLLAIAGKDRLVDNAAIRRAAKLMPHADILELPESRHEIFMETDDIRARFLKAFEDLLIKVAVRNQIKPF